MYIKYIGSMPTVSVRPLGSRVVLRDEPIDAPGDIAEELLKQRTWITCTSDGVAVIMSLPANDPPAVAPPADETIEPATQPEDQPPADETQAPTEPEAPAKLGRRSKP